MAALLVQTDRILHNLHALREELNTPVIPVLGGNAMGMGDFEVARLLAQDGVRLFAACRIEEAARLAAVLPDAEILLLYPYCTEKDAETIVNLNLTAAVGSYDSAVLLNGIAEKSGVKCRIQFVFDTGLGHGGFLPEEADKAVQAVKYLRSLELRGCFTELVDRNGKNKKRVLGQISRFSLCVEKLKKAGIEPGMLHMSGASAALRYRQLRLDAVRADTELFGRGTGKRKPALRPVGKFKTEVREVRWLPAGRTIGEGGVFKADRAMRVAIIPAGYADGIFLVKAKDSFRFRDILRYRREDFRLLFQKERPCCEIAGKKARLLGAVGACSIAADVSSFECRAGDPVDFDVDPLNVNAGVERMYV